jgi:soluble lytic murein transglycosylase-like protein
MTYWKIEDLKEQMERARAAGWLTHFEAVYKKTGVSRAILMGIASRESGMQNVIANHGHGYGVMQINDHDHWKWLQTHDMGMDPASNIEYASSILCNHLVYYKNDYLKAVAAYRVGARNVDLAINKGLDPDFYTPGKNYASDIMARSEIFRQLRKKV